MDLRVVIMGVLLGRNAAVWWVKPVDITGTVNTMTPKTVEIF
jgi:hypothetical protein